MDRKQSFIFDFGSVLAIFGITLFLHPSLCASNRIQKLPRSKTAEITAEIK